MFRPDAGDAFRRVGKVDKCLINKEVRTRLFMGPYFFEHRRPVHQHAGRIIWITEELCHRGLTPAYRDTPHTCNRDPIFPKGMRGNRDGVAWCYDCHTIGTDDLNRTIPDTDFIRTAAFEPRNMFFEVGVAVVRVGRYGYFIGIP